jgi:hypothetical protein
MGKTQLRRIHRKRARLLYLAKLGEMQGFRCVNYILAYGLQLRSSVRPSLMTASGPHSVGQNPAQSPF